MRRSTHRLMAVTVLASVFAGTSGCSSSSSSSSTSSTGTKETFCPLLLAFRDSNDGLDTDVTSGDPAAVQAAVQRLVTQAKTLQRQAPSGISPDVTLVATFLADLDGLFAKYGYDLATLEADADAAEAFTQLNSAEVQAAQDQLRAYGDTICAEVVASSTGPTSTTLDSATTVETSTTVSP